ncbi:hypothetical protein HDV05_008730 [Chytridiales sp. JEL 0842]|nr:hypothetical protein HDV05_008730 [Chytridiales sp. JEL 0842]
MIVTSAPGKVILFGEHAVVYGKVYQADPTAIAASLGLRTYAYFTPRSDGIIKVNLADVGLLAEWKLSDFGDLGDGFDGNSRTAPQSITENLKSILAKKLDVENGSGSQQAAISIVYLYLRICGINSEGVEISVKSALPVGSGLGSSASYSVCIASGLLILSKAIKHNDKFGFAEDELNLINQWAFVSEQVIHGNPSGIDNTLCTFGGARKYEKGKPLQALSGVGSLRFLLTDTKVEKNTKIQVEKVKARYDQLPEVMQNIMDSVQAVSDTCIKTFAEADPKDAKPVYDKLEALIQINQHLMVACGVSHPSIDLICQITAAQGLQSKLTGAGGGGCTLTLLRDNTISDALEKTKSLLKAEGFDCFETTIGCPGVQGRQLREKLGHGEFQKVEWDAVERLFQ